MPELQFRIAEVAPMPYTASPVIAARLYISNSPAHESIQSISLNCQVQLQPLGRAYSAIEESRLLDLFGERARWGQTMKPLHWTNVVLKVPPFTGEIALDLPLPCSLDFEIAANKYLRPGLRFHRSDGDVQRDSLLQSRGPWVAGCADSVGPRSAL